VTDPSNAARTMLMDLQSLQWNERLLALFDIPRQVLPEIVPSCGVAAATNVRWLGRLLPIAGIAGDQQAATFGQACFAPGMAKNTLGRWRRALHPVANRPPVQPRHARSGAAGISGALAAGGGPGASLGLTALPLRSAWALDTPLLLSDNRELRP
jgi:glycerol kinase